jgi:cellulose synthase/poly-beta-1,6-N-acetylglucosamine synthase-like glycosyltransferase
MIVLFIILNMIYMLFMLALNIAWRVIMTRKTAGRLATNRQISVIVPVRNEQKNIQKLLNQLAAQDYPKERYEIIVVDDHSSDQTASMALALMEAGFDNMSLVHLEGSKRGKKAALTQGINKANGEIIITTDGDCQVGEKWLKSIDHSFDEEVKMVFGPVAMRAETFFEKLQMIDFAALIGVGAATWQLGMEGMCNGANLAFRKDVFWACNGYQGTEQYPSGDDEFLLRKIHLKYPDGIRFLKNYDAVVYTEAQPGLDALINQRKRWAGKWKVHKDFSTRLIAMFVFFYYALFLATTIWSIAMAEHFDVILVVWCVKWLLDVVLVQGVLRLSNQQIPVMASMVLSLAYPFYAIGIGISTINYTFEWKGRQY